MRAHRAALSLLLAIVLPGAALLAAQARSGASVAPDASGASGPAGPAGPAGPSGAPPAAVSADAPTAAPLPSAPLPDTRRTDVPPAQVQPMQPPLAPPPEAFAPVHEPGDASWLGLPREQAERSERDIETALGLDPARRHARAVLGERLFFDRGLSINGAMSCGMCHVQAQAFTSNELATPLGIEGRSLRRNAPTILNVRFNDHLFHDGRDTALHEQLWGPMLARNEMGNPSVGEVLRRVRTNPDYPPLFEQGFGSPVVTPDRVGEAIAAFERTLVSGGSPFDRFRYGGQADALPQPARRGFELFTGAAGCSACHRVGEHDAVFSDGAFHNTGVAWRRLHPPATHRVALGDGTFAEVDQSFLRSMGDPPMQDTGRFEVTLDPADRWHYKTPSLRNVARTPPYMHDGSLATLEQVVAFYDGGGSPDPEQDPRIRPLGLSAQQRADLVEFLRSLDGVDAH